MFNFNGGLEVSLSSTTKSKEENKVAHSVVGREDRRKSNDIQTATNRSAESKGDTISGSTSDRERNGDI